MNLRPRGRDGELTLPSEVALAYYREWADLWERQAWIKARACAGDEELGARFLQSWRRSSISPTRGRASRGRSGGAGPVGEDKLGRAAEEDLKDGPGGIRDAEFTVQALQLAHGPDGSMGAGEPYPPGPEQARAEGAPLHGPAVRRGPKLRLAQAGRALGPGSAHEAGAPPPRGARGLVAAGALPRVPGAGGVASGHRPGALRAEGALPSDPGGAGEPGRRAGHGGFHAHARGHALGPARRAAFGTRPGPCPSSRGSTVRSLPTSPPSAGTTWCESTSP